MKKTVKPVPTPGAPKSGGLPWAIYGYGNGKSGRRTHTCEIIPKSLYRNVNFQKSPPREGAQASEGHLWTPFRCRLDSHLHPNGPDRCGVALVAPTGSQVRYPVAKNTTRAPRPVPSYPTFPHRVAC